MNETIPYKNWLQRNRIWLFSSLALLLLLFICLPKGLTKGATHLLIGYSDVKLVDSVIVIANKNERVIEMLGNIKPMDKLTMLEGFVSYSEDLDSVFMALTVKGIKENGKLDIYAFKNNQVWEYERLTIRLKEPKFKKRVFLFHFLRSKNIRSMLTGF